MLLIIIKDLNMGFSGFFSLHRMCHSRTVREGLGVTKTSLRLLRKGKAPLVCFRGYLEENHLTKIPSFELVSSKKFSWPIPVISRVVVAKRN